MSVPRATARLQFYRGFTLDDAVAIVPYLHRLGISHVYASPLFTARPGSTHGYDVIDPNVVNPELGGEAALRRLVAALRARGMGLVLDIVPNHMAVGGSGNVWWQDLLEWGRASPYADFFDIDWNPAAVFLRGKLLAPFLGKPYGICLEAGEITLRFDPADGRVFAAYYDHRFPLAPRDYPKVLAGGGGALAAAVAPLAALPAGARGAPAARERAAATRRRLTDPELAPAVAAALTAFAPCRPEGRARLHAVLERQAYRLAWWRAADEINWRRFFDITGLAGLRAERAAVFAATHEGVLRLYAEGLIDGVRIDHVDGLADPGGYCRRLRRHLAAAAARRPPGSDHAPAPIWVEKILAAGERLPPGWDTDGTTGYDFMDRVSAVLHDPAGVAALTATWVEASGRPPGFIEEVAAARRQILRDNLAAEAEALAVAVRAIALQDPATRDYGLAAIRRVLDALLAHFPVYRIYAGPRGPVAADIGVMRHACALARASLGAADHALLGLIGGWLGGDGLRALPASVRAVRLRAMLRFQHLTAPAVAKSVEDTAFYRYGRLLSRNEVGSDPETVACGPEAFHADMRARRARWPRALLATATHDQKRGEDTRARLAVLSERPDLWADALGRWMRHTAGWRHGDAPDPADAAILFQAILGAWPLDLSAADPAGLARFGARMAAWQQKALREAKRRSGWGLPDGGYESACQGFLARLLDPTRSDGLTEEIAGLVARIAPAGALNGLAQTALRLTVPGIPDLYQGTEVWDFSLVDPDNRRPVDFGALASALTGDPAPDALLPQWRDGRVKQAMIRRLLGMRARLPSLFAAGAYRPLLVVGARAQHALAFARIGRESAAVVVVSRLAALLPGVERMPLVAPEAWGDTEVVLPRRLPAGEATCALTGAPVRLAQPRLRLGALLAGLPVATLVLR
ncbi:MAG: malto-oligosyltrehalose synthase [Rhodospirillales bacterium]|nr:malto-oligosyltrehalose synthase [Rhodospirillales bacterium]